MSEVNKSILGLMEFQNESISEGMLRGLIDTQLVNSLYAILLQKGIINEYDLQTVSSLAHGLGDDDLKDGVLKRVSTFRDCIKTDV